MGTFVSHRHARSYLRSADCRVALTAWLLSIARLGYAQWLFGHIYEAVVKMPERLALETVKADARLNGGTTSVLGPGSPVRYYTPVAPAILASTSVAVATCWALQSARRWLIVTAGCLLSGLALTAFLVRAVNLKVMFVAKAPPPAERDARIRVWYRLNIVRIAAVGAALFAADRASQEIAKYLGVQVITANEKSQSFREITSSSCAT